MPSRPNSPCHYPSCPTLLTPGTGYCDAHKTQGVKLTDSRGSAAKRGYDSPWRRFRLIYLTRHPLCVDCLDADLVRPATEIHHVAKLRDRPDLKFDPTNLRGLCQSCHATRTARGE